MRDLQIWHASLDVDADRLQGLADTLSDDERARAARFCFDRDRSRFIAARGVLREILGTRLDVEPHRLRFGYGSRGKPHLSPEFSRNGLFFNVAHSQGHAAIAVGRTPELGVDLEVIRPVRDASAIAERFFAPRESAAIEALPGPLRLVAFFQCWTRKEAYIKALGEGLAHPLDQFEVTVTGEEPVRLLRLAGSEHAASSWFLHDLSDLPLHACAVAMKGRPTSVRVGRWAVLF